MGHIVTDENAAGLQHRVPGQAEVFAVDLRGRGEPRAGTLSVREGVMHLVLFVTFLRIRSAPARNPFNSQSLISHLTNSNGCGNLHAKVADSVPVSSLLSSPTPCVFA